MTGLAAAVRLTLSTFSMAILAISSVAQMPAMPPLLESTRPQLQGELPLYPGTPPGSKPDALPEQWDTMGGFYMARNVTIPTIIPVLPDPAKATGAAVLIAPGGAYMALAMDTEGLMAAREFAKRGIAAFVLKILASIQLRATFPVSTKPLARAWAAY